MITVDAQIKMVSEPTDKKITFSPDFVVINGKSAVWKKIGWSRQYENDGRVRFTCNFFDYDMEHSEITPEEIYNKVNDESIKIDQYLSDVHEELSGVFIGESVASTFTIFKLYFYENDTKVIEAVFDKNGELKWKG